MLQNFVPHSNTLYSDSLEYYVTTLLATTSYGITVCSCNFLKKFKIFSLYEIGFIFNLLYNILNKILV